MKTFYYSLPSAGTTVSLFIEKGLLKNRLFIKEKLGPLSGKFAVITDSTLAPLVADPLVHLLRDSGFGADLISFTAGEASKSRATKEALEDALFEKGYGRDSAIIAVGGGVVTDLAGFVAATFCRGIPLINVPTSLLGMVDASIGGKTGVNTPHGKNLVGAIYQPKCILIDVEVLKTLPQKEFREGLSECIKHGAIQDEKLFELLERESLGVLNRHESLLEKVILESCRIKGDIVSQDELETGKRRLLNFGHTVAHALEKTSRYQLSHGDAVALGMVIESRLFVERMEMEAGSFQRLFKLIKTYGFPLELPNSPLEEILGAMLFDKKSVKRTPASWGSGQSAIRSFLEETFAQK